MFSGTTVSRRNSWREFRITKLTIGLMARGVPEDEEDEEEQRKDDEEEGDEDEESDEGGRLFGVNITLIHLLSNASLAT